MSAGITSGIVNKTGFGGGITEGMSNAQRVVALTKRAVLQGGVGTVLSAATGDDVQKTIGNIWRGEALNAGLAFGQSVIGDVGVHYSGKELAQEITNANVINGSVASNKLLNSVLGEGTVGKVVMHAGLGAVHGAVLGGDSGAIVGAIGGAIGEIVPNILDQHMSGGVGSNSPPLSGPKWRKRVILAMKVMKA